jgi:PAS domain S-box-containing protein
MFPRTDATTYALTEQPAYAAVVRDICDGFGMLDRAGRYVYIDYRAAKLMGGVPEDLLGQVAWQHFPEQEATSLSAAVQDAFDRQVPAAVHLRMPELRLRLVVKLRPHGLYLAILLVDVSKLSSVEAERTGCDACFGAAEAEMGVGVAYLGLDGELLQVNQRLCDILGYTSRDLTGLSFRNVSHSGDRVAVVRRIDLLLAGESASSTLECRFIRSDGTPVSTQLTVFLVRDESGRPCHFIVAVEDVDERRKVIARLRSSKERLRLFIENAPAAMAMFDREMRYLVVSKRWAQQYEMDRSVIGRNHYDAIPDIPERWRAVHRRCMAGAIERSEEEHWERADGTVSWGRYECAPWYDANGEIGGIIIFAEYLTERKRLEAQLLQSQKLDSIGRLAGGIAHDFNNLLTAILCVAELMQEESEPDSPLQERLRGIIEPAQSAARLTQQLLAYARQQVIKPEVVDIDQLVTRLGAMLRRLVPENIELTILSEPELNHVKVDPGQFEQVLVNLVVNARDAMPDGGRISITARNVTVPGDDPGEPGDAVPGAYVRLAVSDTGAGMDIAVRQRVFEPFFTTKQKGRGTGLGLATVYGIVRQAGGHIWVRSDPGCGATFNVLLPQAAEGLDSVRAVAAGPPRPGGQETILLVEDEKPVRSLAVSILRAQGYNVLEAGDGEEALAVVQGREKEIDLLVSDVVMPRMGGKELAERLHASHPELVVLLCSGYAEDVIANPGAIEQAFTFLPKPFTPSGLSRKIRDLLDGRDIRPVGRAA